MNKRNILTSIALSAMLLAGASAARAETMDDMRFGDLMAAKMMDSNKDGMISRAEFVDMMGKMWDAKAKKMGVKGGKMSIVEFDEVLKYMKAGG